MGPGASAQGLTPPDGFADPQSWRALLSAEEPGQFSQAWLQLLVGSLEIALLREGGTVLGGFVALRGADGRRYVRTATYGGGEVSFLLAKAAERCLQVRRNVGQTGGDPDAPAQIAVPIMIADAFEGVVALELSVSTPAQIDRATRLAQWGTAWFLRIFRKADNGEQARGDLIVRALGVAVQPGSLASVGQALCSHLADALGADRVSLGAATHGPQRAIATSRGGLATSKTDFIVALEAAFDEGVAAGTAIMTPPPVGQLSAIGAHERLCRSHGAAWAASFPVKIEDRWLVLCIEGQSEPPTGETFAIWHALAGVLAPPLVLRMRAQRSLPQHAGGAVMQVSRDWTVAAPRWRLGVVALAVAATIFLVFARGDYRVAAHAAIEGTEKRSIVTPFDGYLAEALVRPGDRVQAGQLLAKLEDRDLRLQRLEMLSRLAEAQHQQADAVGRHDMSGAAVAIARRLQVEAELRLLDDNLSRASLVAPFDALVISGDPTQSIGAPLRRGEQVYEVSPMLGFRVAMDVDEADFAEITTGQAGRVLLSSLPDTRWDLIVRRVTPIAAARDGRTLFRVDADLLIADDAARSSLRPGMQGVARIEIGPRRYIWMWTHSTLAWARLKLWELLA